MGENPLAGWGIDSFTASGMTRPVYVRGEGPAVIVIHEVPGITPAVAAFADEVVDAGFTVLLPSLVGQPGRGVSQRYLLRSLASVCVAREFTNWATGQTSPVIGFLKHLARDAHEQYGGPGVGAVGMCFSGGFALGMMVDGHVAAPVLSQPSLPFAVGGRRSADLNLSAEDLAAVRDRVAGGCQVLGLRFDSDRLVGTRFDSLRRELGDGFIAVEYPSSSKRDHSVLTEHRVEAGVRRVVDFLREKLVV